MSDYAIGDVQGCYEPLQRLLEHIDFDEKRDRLWFVGDLVNRGPQSLEVLRFVKNLPLTPRITLGNHDLHLLNKLFAAHPKENQDDSLQLILAADDREELGHWLRKQAILIHDDALNILICHAGIAPVWDLAQAKHLAHELEMVLAGNDYQHFLTQMYGNQPDCWSDDLLGIERLRVITNYFTRMRFCDANGCLLLGYKGTIKEAPVNHLPWYAVPQRKPIDVDVVFGHWAALEGRVPDPKLYPIDTGCLWGGTLTALRLQDRRRFSVPGLSYC
ncbi:MULTISPECIES: symmetrical bis(5'-nucleosyl)-tetraphosphatase [unclassified Legionella]|uniref:symmetrical bis(5'-nucleosyl)-tetraphosphatase n=1 Tax=unclassified Legionella TaxID=2622702 RepID=UPI0010553B73|nr:symmetrical bis(5'-nucleosyl)-tetraphosphatase [Legionella sp. W10-070]MDI9818054.1 symmetrical bis(5'-nucleosyl)-tetraphosphatase [Legionella sp. PL877]